MAKNNLMPQPAQPINRINIGQLPPELAELSEAALQLQQGGDVLGSASILASYERVYKRQNKSIYS